MNPTTPLHEDSLIDLPPETPHQEAQRCTRNTPCRSSGCTICPTPTNHVRNLDVELGTDETTPTPPTSSDLPPPHPIIPSSSSLLPSKTQSRRTEFMPLRLYPNNSFTNWKPIWTSSPTSQFKRSPKTSPLRSRPYRLT